jgi:phosphate transport system substrate-binding protein
MKAVLRELNATPGVIGSMFCDASGRTLAEKVPSKYSGQALHRATAELARRAAWYREHRGHEGLFEMRHQNCRLVMKTVGDFILFMLCATNVNLRDLHVALALAMKKLEWLVEPTELTLQEVLTGVYPISPELTMSIELDLGWQEMTGEMVLPPPLPISEEPHPPKRWALTLGIAGLVVLTVILGIFGARQLLGWKGAIPRPMAAAAAPAPAIVMAAPLLNLSAADAVGMRVGSALAEAFLASVLNVEVHTTSAGANTMISGEKDGVRQSIAIMGGATETGLDALQNGGAEIAITSRRINEGEARKLSNLGEMTSSNNEHVVALDGVALIVNPANRVPRLSLDQLASLFGGTATTWRALEASLGPASKWVAAPGIVQVPELHLYAPQGDAAVVETFSSRVLRGRAISPSVKWLPGAGAVQQAVVADAGGIGIVPLPSVGSARAVPVAEPGRDPVAPTPIAIATEDYFLAHRLYLYLGQTSGNPYAARFVEFALGVEGQAAVKKTGLVDLEVQAEPRKVPAGVLQKALGATAQPRRLSSVFRFEPGSSLFDNRSLDDLARVVRFLKENELDGSSLYAFGFSDPVGTEAQTLEASKQRGEQLAQALGLWGVTGVKVEAAGAALPVADNGTEEGRQRNRRVELWLAK